jgi:tyrosyl-tRNA synthetase
VAEVRRQLETNAVNPRDLKRRLARELVTLYHDAAAARAAEEEFDRIFVKKDLPDEIPEMEVRPENGAIGIIRLLTETGLAASNSDARRLIEQGGVSVDGKRIDSQQAIVELSSGVVLKVGKRKFVRVKGSGQQ